MSHLEQLPEYCERAFGPPKLLIKHLRKAMRDMPKFDTLIGTGLSGALVVPTLARELRKHWAIVRKTTDGCHSDSSIEGRIDKRWLFVDDFVDTGKTIKRVYEEVTSVCRDHGHETEFVGMWAYYPRVGKYVPVADLEKYFHEPNTTESSSASGSGDATPTGAAVDPDCFFHD